ncbi:hypothetical protein BFW89_16575 [Pseudomonas synxantha]|nr:hypothetical protein BFW89_16575 [Pseudomonas synxantha]
MAGCSLFLFEIELSGWGGMCELLLGAWVFTQLWRYAGPVGGGLLPMAASGPTRMLDQTEYISVIWVTADIGSAFTAGHF